MEIVTKPFGREIIASNNCLIRRVINKDAAFSKAVVLPHETSEDFEEITEEEYQAEQNNNELNEKYAEKVDELIRAKYSISAELAILRQRDTKPSEFANYNIYAEECKQKAKEELGII